MKNIKSAIIDSSFSAFSEFLVNSSSSRISFVFPDIHTQAMSPSFSGSQIRGFYFCLKSWSFVFLHPKKSVGKWYKTGDLGEVSYIYLNRVMVDLPSPAEIQRALISKEIVEAEIKKPVFKI